PIIRNDTGSPGTVTITYYDAGGNPVLTRGDLALAANGRLIDTPPSNFTGSADVGAPQDVSVEVENLHTNSQGTFDAATNYTGVSPSGQGDNPDWGQAATTLYAPTVKYNLSGRTTDL